MKATGIIRRVDDLGRVVIPKEIRKNLGIMEGDALEIFTDGDAVCFHKYRSGEDCLKDAYANLVSTITNTNAFDAITDDDYTIVSYLLLELKQRLNIKAD